MNEVGCFSSNHISQIFTDCLLQMAVLKTSIKNLSLGIPNFKRPNIMIVGLSESTVRSYQKYSLEGEVSLHSKTSLELHRLLAVETNV